MLIRAFDPYLATRGGGERYFLEACLALSQHHDVEIVSLAKGAVDAGLLSSAAEHLGVSTNRLRTVPWSRRLLVKPSLLATLNRAGLALTVTNVIPEVLTSRHVSILQFPWNIVDWTAERRLAGRRALRSCELVLVYSHYVRTWIERYLDYSPQVLYPPVTLIKPIPKDQIILSVGRFTAGGHNKKHAAMIGAFERLAREGLSGWALVLVGSASPTDQAYIDELARHAGSARVVLLPNLGRTELETLYAKSAIYWHATGYEEDEVAHPERFEHFGIAVVEAMSAACVPLVFNGGGLPEIVEPGLSGWLWSDMEQLVSLTRALTADAGERNRIGTSASDRAREFSVERFRARFLSLLDSHSLL
jgi:glycosyltransferase involved in cell wall biosynthesis